MSLESFVSVTAIPECFERLQADAERMRGDLERLQRFVELCAGAAAPAPAPAGQREETTPAAPAPAPVRRGDPVVIHVSALGEESIEKIPSPLGGRSRAEMEATAKDAAMRMIEQMKIARWPASWALASFAGLIEAIREMRDASQGFQCSQTMDAILKALDDIHEQVTTEGQANG